MNRKEIKETAEGNGFVITFHKDNQFTIKRSYFYRPSGLIEDIEKKVVDTIPGAVKIDSGDHFHAFVGGAKSGSAKDSYGWVRFQIHPSAKEAQDFTIAATYWIDRKNENLAGYHATLAARAGAIALAAIGR